MKFSNELAGLIFKQPNEGGGNPITLSQRAFLVISSLMLLRRSAWKIVAISQSDSHFANLPPPPLGKKRRREMI
jgi:hypothetical protein